MADAVLRDGQAVQRPEVVEVLDAPGSTERRSRPDEPWPGQI